MSTLRRGWCGATLAAALLLGRAAAADTTISLSANVVTPNVRRLGLDIAMINYYDSGQVLKELVFNNPGFEGLLFSSVIQIGSATATNGVESMPFTSWPSGFWAGASYEFIYGAAKGRTGSIVSCTNPRDPGANTNGMTYVFDEGGTVPAGGDWMILRKVVTGDSGVGGHAYQGWNTTTTNGGSITSELADLPTNTPGRQCVRLTATNAGAQAVLTGQFDSWRTARFVQLDGQFRLAFKAKGAGGANQLLVTLRRGSEPYYLNQTVPLTNDWRDYSLSFAAAETNTDPAIALLRFSPVNQSALLLDDVSLRQTNSDPANVSEFRDPVVAAIDGLQPGFLRYPNWQHYGDSLDNALAVPFARMRTEYNEYATSRVNLQLGLHDFLVLCESRGCNPWFSTPIVSSTNEYAQLMEYFGGPTNTPYGARRAALGHPRPWTEVFSTLYVEFGNESWNPVYRGGAIFDVYAFGARGSELFGMAKASPYYDPDKFLFVLGEQAVSPWRLGHVHNASANHDLMCVGPYMLSQLDSYATQEEIYGPLYAEPEWWCRGNGILQQHYTNLQASSRPVPLAVYEFNLNVPNGNPSQAACDAYQATIGGSLAVVHMMLLMLHDQHIRDQGLFSLSGFESPATGHTSALWSVVHDMGVTDRKRPQYLAAKIGNVALAGDMISTAHSGDNPTWTVTNLNRVAFTNAHELHSYAFATRTHSSLIVFNLSRSNALPVQFAGYHPPRGTVQMQRLASPNITDNNERSNVVAIAYTTLTNFDPAVSFLLPAYSMTLLQWPAPFIASASVDAGGQVNLAWPHEGFVLQATADLLSGSWTNIASGTNALSIPTSGEAARFFRLAN